MFPQLRSFIRFHSFIYVGATAWFQPSPPHSILLAAFVFPLLTSLLLGAFFKTIHFIGALEVTKPLTVTSTTNIFGG